jgi:hypothetical protein
MKNSATTFETLYIKTEDCITATPILLKLNMLDKIADAYYSLMSKIIISIVVALFTQLIKFKSFECLSGFCYHNKSEIH